MSDNPPPRPEPRRTADLEARVRELEEYKRETQIRLENGIHSFSDLKKEQAERFGELKQEIGSLKPKPPTALALFGTLFTAVVVILGAWWTLSEKFSDRPTQTVVAKMITDAPPKPETVVETKSLRDDIVKLRLKTEDLSTKLEVLERERDRQRR